MTRKKLLAGLLLSASALMIVVESLCPDEDIEPCRCEGASGNSVLRCKNIADISVLEKVAKKSDGYKYDEVHIEDSTLQFIPKVVPETIRTEYLAFRNMTLSRLVESIPNTLDELKIVVLQRIKTLNGFSWEVFNKTKGLESLIFDRVPIPIIKEDFNTHVTHNLKTLYLQYTGTKEIRKGAFEGFKSLQKLSFVNTNLHDLKRDLFPVPFYVEYLILRNNKLTVIPNDFFLEVPHLRSVLFNGNLISRFNEPVTGSIIPDRVDVSENPIKCDCYLKWIANRNAKNIQGSCAAPKQLKGKSLQHLAEDDFDC